LDDLNIVHETEPPKALFTDTDLKSLHAFLSNADAVSEPDEVLVVSVDHDACGIGAPADRAQMVRGVDIPLAVARLNG
jgi:hypothetical protein